LRWRWRWRMKGWLGTTEVEGREERGGIVVRVQGA
jgi:hypothetical protein